MFNSLFDAIFPHRCVGCGKLFHAICKECSPHFSPFEEEVEGIGRILCMYKYEGIVQKSIQTLKFHRYPEAALVLMREAHFFCCYPLIQMPSSKKAQIERGYVQTKLLARIIAGKGMVHCLQKVKESRQVGKTREERLAQPPELRVVGNVPIEAVLFDDVFTTGSSLRAAVTVLERAGVRVIGAIVLARDM